MFWYWALFLKCYLTSLFQLYLIAWFLRLTCSLSMQTVGRNRTVDLSIRTGWPAAGTTVVPPIVTLTRICKKTHSDENMKADSLKISQLPLTTLISSFQALLVINEKWLYYNRGNPQHTSRTNPAPPWPAASPSSPLQHYRSPAPPWSIYCTIFFFTAAFKVIRESSISWILRVKN